MNVFPEERDLPEGRHRLLKEFVMTEIQATAKPRRRLFRPMVLAPVLGLAAAAAVAVPLVLSNATPAFAVVKSQDGTVNITFNEAKDPKPLEDKLRAMGLNVVVDYIPDGKKCSPQPRSESWVPKEEAQLSVFRPDQLPDKTKPTFQIDPSVIKEGQTGVLAFSVNEHHPDGVVGGIWARVSNGPVAPCELVDSDGAPLDLK